MSRTYEYLFFLSSFLFMCPLMLLCGRVIGCWYPFLLSGKHYLTIKHPKLQALLIADGRNRSKSTLTRPEDRDKLSLFGILYYLLMSFLWAAALVLTVYILLTDLLRIPLADRQGLARLDMLLIGSCLLVYLLLFLLSWLDYGLGKLLFGPPTG